MENLYLPILNDNFQNNNLKVYAIKYNKDVIARFLEYIKVLYQDKYISICSNDLVERNVNPLIYTILMDMMSSNILDLRFFEVYMCVNFKEKNDNNYTENDKINILSQLQNNESISKDIKFSMKEEISNLIYKIELQQVSKNLTFNEKRMTIKEFEDLIYQFFDLCDIDKVKLKRNYMAYIMDGKDEIASINTKILNHNVFQKVYKKFF